MSIETENSAYGERSAASTMISQEERQAWRENHRPAKAGSIKGACVFCGASPWPCPIIRLLDALAAAERPAPPAEGAAFEAAWKPWIEGREQVRYRPSMRDAGRAMWDAALKHEAERRAADEALLRRCAPAVMDASHPWAAAQITEHVDGCPECSLKRDLEARLDGAGEEPS